MSRPAVTPKPGIRKPVPLKLQSEDAVDLQAFCEALFGAKQNRVIAEALRRFIKLETERDTELNSRFLEAQAKILKARTSGPEGLRLVSARDSGDTNPPKG